MVKKIYSTDNLALCPYLEMNGLKYLKAELSVGKNDRSVVIFIFEDNLGVGRDLERSFMHSNEKKYRDLGLFFRNEIEKLKRQMAKLQIEESRAGDERYIDIIKKVEDK
jgi:hypothetical protein